MAETIQERRKAWADRNGKHKMFKEDDWVVVFNSRLGKHLGKLKLRWVGPCIIEKEVAPETFTLRNLDDTMHLSKVNGCRMKPYTRGRNEE